MIDEYKFIEYVRKQLLTIIDDDEEVSIDGVIERFKEELIFKINTEENKKGMDELFEEDKDYMDDYDDNPIIEEDIRDVLLDFDMGCVGTNPLDFYVDRHYWSDGKHKVTLTSEKHGEIECDVNAYTKREDFKEMLKEILTELRE